MDAARAALTRWRGRGGDLSGVKLKGVDSRSIQADLQAKLRIDVSAFASSILTEVTSGTSNLLMPSAIPLRKYSQYCPEIMAAMESLLETDRSKDWIVLFWSSICNKLFLAVIENIALSADDQDKNSKKYQQAIIKIRNEGAADWKTLNEKGNDGLAKEEAYPFFMITYYVLLDQFTYMVKHGGGDISNVTLSLQDTSILTSNVDMVLYNIAGWIASVPGRMRVRQELAEPYKAFKANNSLERAAAAAADLPVDFVDSRSKGGQLTYASNNLLQLVRRMECVYRKHCNQDGFARLGGNLLKYVKRALLDSKDLYTEFFLPCIDGIECGDEVKRMIFDMVVTKYNVMRGKYLVKAERARQTTVGNQVFTLRQSVEAARLIAEGRAQANAAIATANTTAATAANAAASSTTRSTEPSLVADTGTNDAAAAAAAAAAPTIDGDDYMLLAVEFSAEELAEMDEKVQERYAQM